MKLSTLHVCILLGLGCSGKSDQSMSTVDPLIHTSTVNGRTSTSTTTTSTTTTTERSSAPESPSPEESLLNPSHPDNVFCGVRKDITELLEEYHNPTDSYNRSMINWYLRVVKDIQ